MKKRYQKPTITVYDVRLNDVLTVSLGSKDNGLFDTVWNLGGLK